MATTATHRYELLINGQSTSGGSFIDKALTLTNGLGSSAEGKVIVDDFGEDVLWTAGGGGLDTYSHGFINSDVDLWVELRSVMGTPQFSLFLIKAGVQTAIPSEIGFGTTSVLDGAILVDATDYASVDSIEVHNDAAAAAGDATVSLYLFG